MLGRNVWSLLMACLTGAFLPGIAPAQERDAPLEWHVAVDGSDAQPGSGNKPFATIQRALDELARRRAASDHRPASVVLHEGTYEIAKPLRIDSQHSSPTGSLTLRAADAAKPVISGGRRLAGWSRNEDGSLSLRLPPASAGPWTFRELFVNDARRPRARHPNEGFLRIAETSPDKRSGFTWKAGDLPSAMTGTAELVFLHDWSISRVAVQAFDHTSHRLTTRDPIGLGFNVFQVDFFEPHPRYFIENHPALLDAPGEWYLQEETGVLTYRPLPGETASTIRAVAPALPALLSVHGSDESPVRNVHLRGITFAHASWSLLPGGYAGLQATVHERRDIGLGGPALEAAMVAQYPAGSPERDTGRAVTMLPAAVDFERVEECSVVDCRVARVGMSGLAFGSRTHRCRIEGCVIEDIAGNCVNIGETTSRLIENRTWWQAAPGQAASHHLIVNNRIQRGGREFFGAVGIWVGIAHDIRIAHNEIRDLPYTGVSVGWMWSPTPTPAANNIIESNHIHHVMQTMSDGGGIYTLGRQPGSTLARNHIHDVPVNQGRAESNGLFIDEGTDDFTIVGNLIYGTTRSPVRFNMAGQNIVRENVLVVAAKETPPIAYNLTDPKLIRQAGNDVPIQAVFDPARYQSMIDAAGPESNYRKRLGE